MVFCHSLSAGSVVRIPWGGVDIQIQPYAKEFEYFALTCRGNTKTSLMLEPPDFPLPIFSHIFSFLLLIVLGSTVNSIEKIVLM